MQWDEKYVLIYFVADPPQTSESLGHLTEIRFLTNVHMWLRELSPGEGDRKWPRTVMPNTPVDRLGSGSTDFKAGRVLNRAV